MRLVVEGRTVDVPAGATLLDALRAAGGTVPTLCHDDRLSAAGSCRTCLVEVRGRGLVASCTTPAAEGMDVRVEAAREARRDALGAVVAGLPERALAVPPERSELVRACRDLDVTVQPAALVTERGRDDSHPYVTLDRDLCIACGRCVRACAEVQGTFAITLSGRGADTVVAPARGGSWVASDCVACGACVDTCPTGALTETGVRDAAPVERWTRTTCGYCGVGCTLDVGTRESRVLTVRPVAGPTVNRGHACVKGRFAHGFLEADDRLTTPLVRRGGGLEPATWDEALGLVAERIRAVRDRDPDRFAVVASSRGTNEESYLLQKLARAVVGTNNVDNCARVCHAPSAAGLAQTFGLGGGTHSLDDLDACDLVLVAGANPTEAHPVVGSRIFARVLDGARLVVVDPRRTYLARHADVHLRARPGTDVALLHGIAHVLVRDGLVDEEFVRRHAEGYDDLRTLLEDYPPDRVSAITGVPAADLERAARLYGAAEAPAIFYGLGITEHVHGTDGVRTLANLAVLRGSVGLGRRGGINPLRGQNNVQGACDMGALPDLLPGYQKVADPRVRAAFGRVWGVEPPDRPGLRIPQMLDAARRGRLDVLWAVGEDLVATDPDGASVRAALEACPFVVCSDPFPSPTAALADVVLPAATWLEKDGTFVNLDRRFQRVREAVRPPDGVRTDLEVALELAGLLGADLGCATPAEVLDDCARVAPHFGGISHERLESEGPLHWPCPDAGSPGTPALYPTGFATPDGRARLAARAWLPPAETPDADFPHLLVTGRRGPHYNSGSMTRRTANADLLHHETLDVSPGDAAALGLATGDPVEVTGRRGRIVLPARITDEVQPGEVFTSFHFAESLVNDLTSPAGDEVTGCPEYKLTAVRLDPVHGDVTRPGTLGT